MHEEFEGLFRYDESPAAPVFRALTFSLAYLPLLALQPLFPQHFWLVWGLGAAVWVPAAVGMGVGYHAIGQWLHIRLPGREARELRYLEQRAEKWGREPLQIQAEAGASGSYLRLTAPAALPGPSDAGATPQGEIELRMEVHDGKYLLSARLPLSPEWRALLDALGSPSPSQGLFALYGSIGHSYRALDLDSLYTPIVASRLEGASDDLLFWLLHREAPALHPGVPLARETTEEALVLLDEVPYWELLYRIDSFLRWGRHMGALLASGAQPIEHHIAQRAWGFSTLDQMQWWTFAWKRYSQHPEIQLALRKVLWRWDSRDVKLLLGRLDEGDVTPFFPTLKGFVLGDWTRDVSELFERELHEYHFDLEGELHVPEATAYRLDKNIQKCLRWVDEFLGPDAYLEVCEALITSHGPPAAEEGQEAVVEYIYSGFRHKALECWVEQQGEGGRPQLLRWLEELPSSTLLFSLLHVLASMSGSLKDPDFELQIARRLRDPLEDTKRVVVELLRKFGTHRSLPALREALTQWDEDQYPLAVSEARVLLAHFSSGQEKIAGAMSMAEAPDEGQLSFPQEGHLSLSHEEASEET